MTTNNHPAQGLVSLERLHQIREHLQHDTQYSNGGNRAYILADMLKVIDEVLVRRKAEAAWLKLQSMLKPNDPAAPQPEPVVPETLPCPVHLEPGLKFGKGVRTQCLLDALRRRADYYAELEAMTPEQRAEHDAGIAEFKAMFGSGSHGDMVDNVPQHAIHTAPTLDSDGKSAFPQRAMQSFGNSEQLIKHRSSNQDSDSNDSGEEIKQPASNCPKCGGYGTYHCPQMLGTVECECTLPAAPQQEVK